MEAVPGLDCHHVQMVEQLVAGHHFRKSSVAILCGRNYTMGAVMGLANDSRSHHMDTVMAVAVVVAVLDFRTKSVVLECDTVSLAAVREAVAVAVVRSVQLVRSNY